MTDRHVCGTACTDTACKTRCPFYVAGSCSPEMRARDEARHDLVQYHRHLIMNRTGHALEIAKKYKLAALSPQMVSLGLEAASHGMDPMDAVERPMERSE